MSKKIFIFTNWTCVRRKLDAKKFSYYFSKNNWEVVHDPRKADVIFMVSCAFTNQRTEQCVEQINRFKKYDGELIIAGCLPAIDPERMKEVFDGRTVVTKEIEKVDELFPEHEYKWNDLKDENIPWENLDLTKPVDSMNELVNKCSLIHNSYNGFMDVIRHSLLYDSAVMTWYGAASENPYFIRPSRGCMSRCAYCAIWKAIGKMKSKPLDVLIKEFEEGLKLGYKEFILDSDDVGCYGMDINSSFSELLDLLTDYNEDYVIDIHYIHPHWVLKYIDDIERILKKGKIRRILSSIQSGNPRILKLMNRYPDTEKLKDAYLRLKKSYPDLLLETETICGFPSETFEEFKDTLKFINDVRFGWGAIFPFSCKTGTKAEEIEPKIPDDEIKRRIEYAKNYLRKQGYDARYAKYLKIISQGILDFCDIEPVTKIIHKYREKK